MSDNFTAEDLAALESAIAKGVKTVKYTDKEITYRSLDEMLKIRDMIRNCLGLNGNQRGLRRVAQTDKALC
jgi:hypothetical protein